MKPTDWHKQSGDKPLFKDMLWSKPENRSLAGKLAIAGGNLYGFAAVAKAYAEAGKAGIGTARALLPDSLKKTVGRIFTAGEYAPSTPSGSFSQASLSELLAIAAWADGLLLAGDLGRNSETAILLENFCNKYTGQLTLTKDAVDYFTSSPSSLLKRPSTTFVVSFTQLQQIAMHSQFHTAFTFDMDLLRLIGGLQELTTLWPVNFILKHLDNFVVAAGGEISTTKISVNSITWQERAAAHAGVWWLQNPRKTFPALTTAMLDLA